MTVSSSAVFDRSEPYHKTCNQHGFMHPPTSISQAFVEFARECQGVVLDIGAAYGVATLPALATGARVIANDMEAQHLELLKAQAPAQHSANLELRLGRFPNQLELPDASVDAILCSHMLTFISPAELEQGAALIARWLKPGGKLFALAYTPYNQMMKPFIEEYERRVQAGDPWPGYIADLAAISARPEISDNLPNVGNVMDPVVLERVFCKEQGLVLEKAEFIPLEGPAEDAFHQASVLDGREWVAFIASKQ